ncbi:MAG: sterol desaturase family protein [Arenibacterium sp.]
MCLSEELKALASLYIDVFGGDLLRYVLGAGGVYLIVNFALAKHLHRQKIRATDPPGGQVRREILASLRTVVIFALTGTVIAHGAHAGWMRVYPDLDTFGVAYVWLSVAALILLHDTWFYWTHRALHLPRLFRRMHRLHHRSVQPTPFTSYSFDWGEALVNAAFLPLILLVLPAHPLALFIFVTHMMLRNALGHCGYEVFPAGANNRPLFDWLTTVTHHDQHHACFGVNFGLYFTWWDRWMGTEHPDYHATFARLGRPLGLCTRMSMLLLAVLVASVAAKPVLAADLRGSYAAPGLSLIVTFAPCPRDAQTRCGRLVWIWAPSEMPHARIGEVILPDLQHQGGIWVGQLKSPVSGWVFRGSLTPIGADRLRLKGCAGPICRTQIWRSTASLRKVLASAQ